MANKRDRRRAAQMYAATLLWHDDGDIGGQLGDELKELANAMLRRIHWPFDHLPSVSEIEKMAKLDYQQQNAASD